MYLTSYDVEMFEISQFAPVRPIQLPPTFT
jgi:hypothetical protein